MRTFVQSAAFVVFSVLAAAQTPGPVSVISYAGFDKQAPVAPGSIASAYGNFGGIATTSWNANLPPMPKELVTVKIRIAGADAPLYFVSSGQINFNVPVATPAGQQTVEVVVGGAVVAQGTVNVYGFFPALAARNTSATRPGVILNENNTDNLTTPAARGSIIQMFATGCGATTPPAVDGVPQGATANATATIQAFVSWDEADVIYAGAQPQFPGVCQVNIRIPDKPYITGDVPVFITAGGIASNPVSVRIQ